jgi:filamentous hemagglutinin
VTSFGTGSILKGALKGVERIAGLARAGHRVEVAEHALKDAVTGAERAIVAAEKHGIELVVGPNASKVDKVIAETLVGNGNITSRVTLSADEALQAGNKWVGPGYRERPTAPGVFTSADGKWQFRMDEGSIAGRHNPNVPHVHFEELIPETGKFKVNNHVPFQD